jgi:hypothetical protein
MDNRQEEQRSTKGQRQTTTMEPIKCLLLLAAVLSFAMNVATMDAQPQPEDILEFLRQVDAAAGRSELNQDAYVVQEGEDGEFCRSLAHMDYMHCICCCTIFSYERSRDRQQTEVWFPNRAAYEGYKGRCICRRRPDGTPAVTQQQYQKALRGSSGRVVDPED